MKIKTVFFLLLIGSNQFNVLTELKTIKQKETSLNSKKQVKAKGANWFSNDWNQTKNAENEWDKRGFCC